MHVRRILDFAGFQHADNTSPRCFAAIENLSLELVLLGGTQPFRSSISLNCLYRSYSSRGMTPCVGVALEAGDHLAVASAVEVPPLAGGLARVVDRAAAREHEAERAGLGARRHAGEHRALVPVTPHIGDDRLVEAAEGVVPGELAARPRERRIAPLSSFFAW